jgi:hypothetical protein
VRTGERVERGAPLATVFGTALAPDQVLGAFVIDDAPPSDRPLVYAVV